MLKLSPILQERVHVQLMTTTIVCCSLFRLISSGLTCYSAAAGVTFIRFIKTWVEFPNMYSLLPAYKSLDIWASCCHHLCDERKKKLPFSWWLSITVSETYGSSPGLDVIYGIPADDLVAVSTAFMEEPARVWQKWYLGVILYFWQIGSEVAGAEIWTSSSVVVQHITLINHLNASFSGPLAWTAAQNKEIESHLNQGCRAELTWNESERAHTAVNTNQAEKAVGAIG